ncbi:MAG: hypothetical protein R3A52_18270 [Polyangiales bacterium]
MRITLDSLDGKQFTLTLPRDGDSREHLIKIDHAHRLRGVYAQDDVVIAMDPVQVDQLIGELLWQLDGGSVHLAGPMSFGPTDIDIDIARGDRKPPAVGRASAEVITVPAMRYVKDALAVQGMVSVTRLLAQHDPGVGAWHITASDLDGQTLQATHPKTSPAAEALHLRGVVADVGDDGSFSIRVAEVSAKTLSAAVSGTTIKVSDGLAKGVAVVRSARGEVAVDVDEIILRGIEVHDAHRDGRLGSVARVTKLRYTPQGVSFDRLDIDELGVAVDGLDAGSDEKSDTQSGSNGASEGNGTSRKLGVDLPLLDHVEGHVSADVKVDARVPVIKRRVATHQIRLALTDGTLDFKQLEGGLSFLEDALLDFEVEENALVLELDALIKQKALVSWPLDDEGMARANNNRVRLRTLAQPTLEVGGDSNDKPEEKPEDKGESAVGLNRVDVDPLDVELHLGGPTQVALPTGGGLRLGVDGTDAVGMLRVHGSLAHDTEKAPDPTEVQVEVENLAVGADDLAVGDNRLSIGCVTLGRLSDATVTFHGLKPAAARGTLRDLSVQTFSLRMPASP